MSVGGSYKKLAAANLQRIEQYVRRIEQLLSRATGRFVSLSTSVPYDRAAGDQFFFADYPEISKEVDKLVSSLARGMESAIVAGTTAEWAHGTEDANGILDYVLKRAGIKDTEGLKDSVIGQYLNNHSDALKAFQKRQIGGITLSQKVWNLANQTKIETELARSIADGTSARDLAESMQEYLNEPSKLFRRVRDEFGVLRLSRNAREYNPGEGVYRSSYKNALRLARTEINMAYRNAEQESYAEKEYVVGIEIKRSNNPYDCDLCEALAGKYPKDFKWSGWHPNCRCYMVPITVTNDEFIDMLGDEEFSPEQSENYVGDVPDTFKAWVADNSDRINDASSRGSLPYFLKDNLAYMTVSLGFDKDAVLSQAINTLGLQEEGLDYRIRKTFQYANDFGVSTKELERMLLGEKLPGLGSVNEMIEGIRDSIFARQDSLSSITNELYSIRNGLEAMSGIARRDLMAKIDAFRETVLKPSFSEGRVFNMASERAARKFLDEVKKDAQKIATTKPTEFTALTKQGGVYFSSIRPVGATDEMLCKSIHEVASRVFSVPANSLKDFEANYAAGEYKKAIAAFEKSPIEIRRQMELSQKVETLGRIPKSMYEKVPAGWRQSLNAAIEKINACTGSLDSVQSEIEYAYNVYRLTFNKLANEIGLNRISPMMPNEILRGFLANRIYLKEQDSLGNPIYGALKQFFDTFKTYVPLELRGAHKDMYYNEAYKMVCLNFGYVENGVLAHIERLRMSDQKYKILFHEFGHAFDHQAGIRSDADFVRLFDKWYDFINEDVNGSRPNARAVIDKMSQIARRKLDSHQDEFLCALSDTYQSLDKDAQKWFGGHEASYFLKSRDSRKAEFIAHMFENYWLGNPLFKEAMDELFIEMIDYLSEFYALY